MEYQQLLEYCNTEIQRSRIEAIIKFGGAKKAARELGITYSLISRAVEIARRNAALKGVAPEKDLNYPLPDAQIITGTSTLQRSPNGNLQWVKTKTDLQEQLALMREAIDALVEDVPRVKPREFEGVGASDELMAVYPLGDPHIGMLAWHEETGNDWDLKIAEETFLSAFDRVVMAAPKCERAVIINLGDLAHYDNIRQETTRSGHPVDADGRPMKMLRAIVKILRRMIERALEHHSTVQVLMLPGNHDDLLSLAISVALVNIYDCEPRVIVDPTPALFQYVRFGKVLFGAHHGHSCKMDKLPLVMASDRSKDWGETEHRYWYTGHIHTDSVKPFPGVSVESFCTLAPNEAYATAAGYRSRRNTKCLVLHREFGEVERHTIDISQLK